LPQGKEELQRKRSSTLVSKDSIGKFKHNLLTENVIRIYLAHSQGSFKTQLKYHLSGRHPDPGVFVRLLFSMLVNSSSLLLISSWILIY
jgi:hypothetical protein